MEMLWARGKADPHMHVQPELDKDVIPLKKQGCSFSVVLYAPLTLDVQVMEVA